jgi:hypothetical protein
MGTTLISKMAMIFLHPENLRFLPAPACGRQGRRADEIFNGLFKKLSSTQ